MVSGELWRYYHHRLQARHQSPRSATSLRAKKPLIGEHTSYCRLQESPLKPLRFHLGEHQWLSWRYSYALFRQSQVGSLGSRVSGDIKVIATPRAQVMLLIQQRWLRQLTQTNSSFKYHWSIRRCGRTCQGRCQWPRRCGFRFLEVIDNNFELFRLKEVYGKLAFRWNYRWKLTIMVHTKSTAALLKTSTKVKICLSFVMYQMVKLQ